MTQHSNNKLLRIISHFHLKGLDRTQPPLCGGKNSKCAANLVSGVSSLSDIRRRRPLVTSAGRARRCARTGAHVLEGPLAGSTHPCNCCWAPWSGSHSTSVHLEQRKEECEP